MKCELCKETVSGSEYSTRCNLCGAYAEAVVSGNKAKRILFEMLLSRIKNAKKSN